MSNKTIICSAALLISSGLAFLGGSFVTGREDAKTYVVPSHISASSDVHGAPPKAIFLEPPTSDKIKKDLAGKTIEVDGQLHSFYGPELNLCKVIDSICTSDDGMIVDVVICGDITIVDRRKPKAPVYSHERISGSMRIYYDRISGVFSYRKAESVNLLKTVTPNAVAPSNDVSVRRYIDS